MTVMRDYKHLRVRDAAPDDALVGFVAGLTFAAVVIFGWLHLTGGI